MTQKGYANILVSIPVVIIIAGVAGYFMFAPSPSPVSVDNAGILAERLLPESAIRKLMGPLQSAGSLHLTSWGAYEQQQNDGTFYMVAPGRQVWVFEAQVPEYDHARLGRVLNASVRVVFDAETGVVIHRTITGQPVQAPLISRKR